MVHSTYIAHRSSPPQDDGVDVETIVQQVARLPLAIPEIAEQQLAILLEKVLASALPADELYFLLEYIRTPLSFVREAAVRHYCAQAPMLDKDADTHFQQGVDAWQRMVEAYARCLDLGGADDGFQMSQHFSTIIHRCLYYQGLTIFEHYRAKRRLPQGLWRRFHSFYVAAEEIGCTRNPVRDELFQEVRVTDCQAAYIAPLLLSAAKPFGHDGQQLEAISRWTAQWAHLAAIASTEAAERCSGFIVNLDEDVPYEFEIPLAPGLHRCLVDTTSLTSHLKRLRELLDHRPPPEKFGLSEDNLSWTRPLLAELEIAWTACSDSRRTPRLNHRAELRISAGFDQIHTLIAGHKLRSSIPPYVEQATEQPGEAWFLVEESGTGCRLVHPAPRVHLQIHQLIALYDESADTYRLAQIQWLMQDALRGIVAGIALLPGQPVAASIRSDTKADKGRFICWAFVLEAHGDNHGIALVLPKGIFKAGRVVYVADGDDKPMELREIIQSGTDFDLVSVRSGV